MLCACTLAIAMLLSGSPGVSPVVRQEKDDKSSPPPSQTAPSTNQSETPSADQAPPPSQNDASEKPKETPPEVKKSPPCANQNGSGKTKCGKRPATQGRRVVRHGSTGEPTAQLAPGMTPEQALRDRKNTEQLLSSTEGSLRQLSSRHLDQSQQDTVSQIRNYLVGSRSALQDGDLSRARTLAFKAHLLADDLVSH